MKLYVDCNAGRNGNGSKEMPFKTIREAAKAAVAGDEVLVAPGVYREYVMELILSRQMFMILSQPSAV